jgi:hypothetical protein
MNDLRPWTVDLRQFEASTQQLSVCRNPEVGNSGPSLSSLGYSLNPPDFSKRCPEMENASRFISLSRISNLDFNARFQLIM